MLCGAYVKSLLKQGVVEYAALWVRAGLMHQDPTGGYELAKEIPEKGAARQISPNDELAVWAAAAGSFGWRLSDAPLEAQPDADPGLMLVFAQEAEIILLLHIFAEGAEIAGIQSSLAELASHLRKATRNAAGPRSDGPVVIDMAFLEAMAMGEDSFVRHMLEMCLEQLVEGSERLAESAASGSVKEVGQHAHRMRSTARTAGAERLDGLLATVEMLADGGCVGAIAPAIHGCEQAITGIFSILISQTD
jgi:HPt (histidine-containing phosphotransfer) domain-containing protein